MDLDQESLLKRYTINSKDNKTERGELLKLFASKTGKSIGYIAKRVTGVKTWELELLKKDCEGARNFASLFYWKTDPRHATKKDSKDWEI